MLAASWIWGSQNGSNAKKGACEDRIVGWPARAHGGKGCSSHAAIVIKTRGNPYESLALDKLPNFKLNAPDFLVP